MRKQTPKLEWHIVENEAEWERQQAQNAAVTPLTGWRQSVQKYAGNVIALLLLLVMAGVWWRTFQAGQQQKAAATILAPSALGGVAPGSDNGRDGGASQNSSDGQPLPQGATVRQNEQWLATPYFIYRFSQQDAAVVQAVAPPMDKLYATLWRNFGLPISPIPDKLLIDITMAQPPGQTIPAFDARQHLRVPAPGRYLAPVGLSDAALLAQSIALPLLQELIAQAKERDGIEAAWQPLLDGLSLWQLWDTDLPLGAWREAVVKWLYVDLPTTNPGEPVVLPARYSELCATHKLWIWAPLQLHIPLLCTGSTLENANLLPWSGYDPPTHLNQLTAASNHWVAQLRGSHPGQTVALATLIEYAVDTYGRDRLPVLVAGLGHYDRWETLIPAVYGVSAAEFEAGWQAYLTAHYGVPVRLPSNPSGKSWAGV